MTDFNETLNVATDDTSSQENHPPINIDDSESAGTEKSAQFSRTVPHAALHAEREEHKKTRAALAQLRESHAQILAQIEKQQPIKSETQNQEQQLEQISDSIESHSALWQIWDQARETSKAQLPDLDQALSFLTTMREQQLQALAEIDTRFQNKQNRDSQMLDELRDLIKVSIERGENPAQMIYGLARGFGYHATDINARCKNLHEAQKAARTLTASNGRETGDPMLMETLANLSEADFARWYEQNPDSFRQLFAG